MSTPRIAVIGPESTGKTALSKRLAAYFDTEEVPEVARGWIENLGRPYVQEDLLEICRAQEEAEEQRLAGNPPVLICDTNITVIRIWSAFRFGSVDPFIIEREKSRNYDLILLTDIDIPWVDDPLREHPQNREELFSIYYRSLIGSGLDFRVVFGEGEDRFRRAISLADAVAPKRART